MATTVLQHVSLKDKTTLRVGGTCRYFAVAKSLADVETIASFAQQKKLSLFVLGSGSNLLVPSGEYNGVVVQMAITGRQYTEMGDGTVVAKIGAGEILDDVIADVVRQGYWGIENLSAIPGTVGATPVQNVGAYGTEISQVVLSVSVYDIEKNEAYDLPAADCMFGYRDSIFKTPAGKKYIITNVTYQLSSVPRSNISYADLANYFGQRTPSLHEIRQAVIMIRAKKFPNWHEIGTAGSFFKNPIITNDLAVALAEKFPELPLYPNDSGKTKVSLGHILDKICGLKGYSEGYVGLYQEQALVLVARTGATVTDVEAFAASIAQRVYDATGISIEQEVQVLR